MSSIKELLGLAEMHCSYWEGEGIGQVIEQDLAHQDYDGLREHLKISAMLMLELEYSPDYEQ